MSATKDDALHTKDSQSETRYRMQLCRNLDIEGAWTMFEGYVTNGMLRHGNSRCSWSDGDVMFCCWNNGHCNAHEENCKKKHVELDPVEMEPDEMEPAKLGTTRSGLSYQDKRVGGWGGGGGGDGGGDGGCGGGCGGGGECGGGGGCG